MADLEAKALDKETLDEIKSELEETKKIIKGTGPRTSPSRSTNIWPYEMAQVVLGSRTKTESLIKSKKEMNFLKIWMIQQII